jgi:hypothetical protein
MSIRFSGRHKMLEWLMDGMERRCCEQNDVDRDHPNGVNGTRPAAAWWGAPVALVGDDLCSWFHLHFARER